MKDNSHDLITRNIWAKDKIEQMIEVKPINSIPQTFIVSDTHFCHAQILEYCARPFKSVEEMNEVMIERWNAVVSPSDVVIHMGDVGFRYEKLKDIIDRLNGKKLLIRGNHDWSINKMESLGFQCLTQCKNDSYVEVMRNRMFHICHRPRDMATIPSDNKELAFQVRLVGHEHNNMPIFIKWVRDTSDVARPIMALNLSIEHWGYVPTHIDKVIEVYDEHIRSYLSKLD